MRGPAQGINNIMRGFTWEIYRDDECVLNNWIIIEQLNCIIFDYRGISTCKS